MCPPTFNGAHDGCKVIVGEYNVSRFLGDFRPSLAHRNSDVCALQRGRVIHAITGDRYNLAGLL
jgi:hypothetical protein